jgi:hypothetical protein
MATQVGAVTGKPLRQRFRRPSSNYILDLFAEREATGQREREFAATEKFRADQLNLAEDAYKHGKTQDEAGIAIAGTGLGLQGLLTYQRSQDADKLYGGRDVTTPSGGGGGGGPSWWEDSQLGQGNYMPTFMAGLGGVGVGQAGKKRWQKVALGAGSAGLMSWLGGGNAMDIGASATLGGGGAGFLDFIL